MIDKYFINKNIFLLLVSRFISQIGDYIFLPAILWLAIDSESGSRTWLGIISIVVLIPPFLGFLFGLIADNRSKRSIMVVSDLIRLCLCILLLCNQITIQSMLIIALIIFLIESLGQLFNISSQSFIPDIIPKEKYLKANSYFSVINNLTGIIGFAVGGILIAILDFQLIILLNALTFTVSALLIYLIDNKAVIALKTNEKEQIDKKNRFIENLTESFNSVFKNKLLTSILLIACIVNMFSASIEMLITVWTHDSLNMNSDHFGILMATILMGALAGGWVANLKLFKKSSAVYIVALSTLLFGSVFLTISFLPFFYINVIQFFTAGIFLSINSIHFTTAIMNATDKSLMGQVFGIIQTFIRGGQPLGVAIVTWLITFVNVSFIFLGIGATIGLAGLTLFLISIKHFSTSKEIYQPEQKPSEL